MERKKAYGPYEAFMLGLDLEEAGRVFYSRVADSVTDFRVKDLFRHLAQAEVEHKRVIREEIEPSFVHEWYREEDQQLMAEYLHDVEKQPVFPDPEDAEHYARLTKDPAHALDIGIRAEKKSIDYYIFLRDATQDAEGKEAFERLRREEVKHLELLQNLKKEL